MAEKRVHSRCATCGADFGMYPNKEKADAHFDAHPECISEYDNGIVGAERGLKLQRPIRFYWVENGSGNGNSDA